MGLNQKHIWKTVILLVVVAIGVFGTTLSRAVYYIPPDELILSKDVVARITPPQQKTLIEDTQEVIVNNSTPEIIYPSHLAIPKIKVDAGIQQVGITKKGNVSAPYNFTDVGWYKYGTFPGDIGNAIIDGHVDNGLGLAGVFSNLKNLNIGDDIYVTVDKDETSHFIVTRIDTYDFRTPVEKIYTETDKRILKLITCAGVWSNEFRTHDQRLVVTATLVE